MNLFTCDLVQALQWIVNLYTIVLFVYAVLSWIPDLRGSRFSYVLASIVEPVLMPIRRIIPPVGGFDLAFLIVLLFLQLFLRPELGRLAFNACIPLM